MVRKARRRGNEVLRESVQAAAASAHQAMGARRVMTEESFTAAAESLLFLHSQGVPATLSRQHRVLRVSDEPLISLQLDHSPHASE